MSESGLTLTIAQREAARITRLSSSSFYWAMRLLPRGKRRAMFAIYAFCRVVDDTADDEGRDGATRLAELDKWRRRIGALYEGRAEHVITLALRPAVRRFGLRKEDFLAIIEGMEMDAGGPLVAPEMKTLDLYCDRVASAVGRLAIRVFGESGELGREIAHHQGRALQLANILRDVDEDARLGRLYLPRELLEKHGIEWSDTLKVTGQPGYAALWRELAEVAAGHFATTHELIAESSADLTASRIMLAVYERNFTRMRALSDRQLADAAFSKRLTGKREKLLIALKVWLGGKA